MDPLSITTSCVGLLSSIADLSILISKFTLDFRDARKDMDAVRRELSSLSLCVENLRDDTSKPCDTYPPTVQRSLIDVLGNCDDVMVEMKTLLDKMSSKSVGRRVQWATVGHGEMNKLRSRLEAHKATIDIALEMVSIFLLSDIKQDTSDIKGDTEAIKQDTKHVPQIKEDVAEILQKISELESQLLQSHEAFSGRAFILQRFLDASTQYADSVLQQDVWDDEEAMRFSPPPLAEDVAREEGRGDMLTTTTPFRPVLNDGVTATLPTRASETTAETSKDLYISTPRTFTTLEPTITTSPSPGSESDTSGDNSQGKSARAILSTEEKAAIDNKLIALFYIDDQLSFLGNRPQLKQVRHLLDNGADPNTRGGFYGNALQATAGHGRTDVVELLLDKGADVNAEGGYYGNALQAAAFQGWTEIRELLLDKGADVNAEGGCYGNALQAAARQGRTDAVKLLLDNGADVNAKGGFHGNALHAAAYQGRTDVVELLLDNGADVNAEGGEYGNALQAAACQGRTDVVQLLLDNGADVNAKGGHYGNALQAAAHSGSLETVQLLLNWGADIDAPGLYKTSFIAARNRPDDEEKRQIIDRILRSKISKAEKGSPIYQSPYGYSQATHSGLRWVLPNLFRARSTNGAPRP